MAFLSKLPPPFQDNLALTSVLALTVGFALYKFFTLPHNTGRRIDDRKRDSEDLSRHLPERMAPMNSLPQFSTHTPYRRAGERRESVAGESVNEEELRSSKKVVHHKTEEVRKRIAERTAKNLLIRNLDRRQKDDIFDAMLEKRITQGEEIIRQGDEGDFFYVVDSGSFDILVNGKKVAESTSGGAFGELALLYLQPRAATVKATTDAVVWAVDRSTFRRIVLGSNARKRMQYQRFLKEVEILGSLTEEEIIKVADALEPVSFSKGDHVVSEGDFGDTFYIIEEGSAVVTLAGEEVARKSKGDYFGEIALLTDGHRVATVKAESDTLDCLVLDKNAFVRLLGPCVDILKRNMETYKKYEPKIIS